MSNKFAVYNQFKFSLVKQLEKPIFSVSSCMHIVGYEYNNYDNAWVNNQVIDKCYFFYFYKKIHKMISLETIDTCTLLHLKSYGIHMSLIHPFHFCTP